MQTEFVKVCTVSQLPPGRMLRVTVEGRDIALVNVDGDVFAIESNCPHQGGPLARGQLDGEVVTCPWHGWRWNVKTGRAVWPPVEWRVPRYDTRLEGQDILVRKR